MKNKSSVTLRQEQQPRTRAVHGHTGLRSGRRSPSFFRDNHHGGSWNLLERCQLLRSRANARIRRWAVDCAVSHGRAMGYERRRYRGYVNLYRMRAERGEKSRTQIDQTLRLPEPFTLPLRRSLPDAKVASGWPVRGRSRDCRARRHFPRTASSRARRAKDGGRNSSVPVSAWIRGATGSGHGLSGRPRRQLHAGEGGKFPPSVPTIQADALCAMSGICA